VIRPLLCNVCVHRLDRAWDTRTYGVLVRYADDLLVMCRPRAQGQLFQPGGNCGAQGVDDRDPRCGLDDPGSVLHALLVTGLQQAHKNRGDDSSLAETTELLYGTALLAEGGALEDPPIPDQQAVVSAHQPSRRVQHVNGRTQRYRFPTAPDLGPTDVGRTAAASAR
jgi:hypothetical protein